MGLGLQGAYGAKAGSDALLRLLAQRQVDEQQALQQQQFAHRSNMDNREFGLRQQEAVDTKAYRDASIQNMNENSASLSASRAAAAEKDAQETSSRAARLQAAQAFVKDPQQPLKMRQAVQYYLTTGTDVPAAFFADPDQTVSNQLAVDATKRERDKADADAAAVADDPKAPRGVKNYVGKLRATYGDNLLGAQREMETAWPAITEAHPHIDRAAINKLMREMFANQVGVERVDTTRSTLASLDEP